MQITKLAELILGALLLAFAAGCDQTTSNNNSSGTNAPAVTNSVAATNN